MIDRDGSFISFTCDECPHGFIETLEKLFSDAVTYAKSEKWLFIKDDDTKEWHHICPDCIPELDFEED